MPPSITDILTAASSYVESIPGSHDRLPVLAAVAHPQKTVIGLTIQKDYPLGMIQREFGLPFGRLRLNNAAESDPDLLHACKWSFDVHIAEFEINSFIERFIRDHGVTRVHSSLSTGIGNLLQNRRSVAYLGRENRIFAVSTENLGAWPPYACLTLGLDDIPSIKLLHFSPDNKCFLVNKRHFREDSQQAIQESHTHEVPVKWAVSGYPLVLDGHEIADGEIAHHVSDLRHMWQLPLLKHAINERLSAALEANIQFFFGFDRLMNTDYFVRASEGGIIDFRLGMLIDDAWRNTVCEICKVTSARLNAILSYDGGPYLSFDEDAVSTDFCAAGYQKVSCKEEVVRAGQFAISDHILYVVLLPAIYPHHVVGIRADGCLVNISIAGQSGRSGITLQKAKRLCKDVGMIDALVFDNGFDVVAQIGGVNGVVMRHINNTRQTRLTAALHLGRPVADKMDQFCGYGEELEMGYTTLEVCGVRDDDVSAVAGQGRGEAHA